MARPKQTPEENYRHCLAGRFDLAADPDIHCGTMADYMRNYPCTCTDEDAYCNCGPEGGDTSDSLGK